MFEFFKNLFGIKSETVVATEEQTEKQTEKEEETHFWKYQINPASILAEAFEEFENEKNQEELNLLNDKNFPVYLKTLFKCMAKKFNANPVERGILFSYTDIGISEKSWPAFLRIFKEISKSIELETSMNGHFLSIDGKEIGIVFNKIGKAPIDIDEKIREMLRQGAYR